MTISGNPQRYVLSVGTPLTLEHVCLWSCEGNPTILMHACETVLTEAVALRCKNMQVSSSVKMSMSLLSLNGTYEGAMESTEGIKLGRS